MMYFLFGVAFAAEPAGLRTSPPGGADLERLDDGSWRFFRPVEIDGWLLREEGIARDGRVTMLRWTASGQAGEALAAWQLAHTPKDACPSRADRRISLRSGVLSVRSERAVSGESQVIIEESATDYPSCESLPDAITGLGAPRAEQRLARVTASHWSVRGGSVAELPFGSVVRDPPPEIVARLHVETTEVPRLQVMRIVGGCLAQIPASGTFQWDSGSGIWKGTAIEDGPGSAALLDCTEALLGPMLPRGTFTVQIAPQAP